MSKKISDKTLRALADAAVEVKKNSYSPYSRFKVGAAVLAEDLLDAMELSVYDTGRLQDVLQICLTEQQK